MPPQTVSLRPVSRDMVERVHAIFRRTHPGAQRLHGDETMDLFETNLILQEAQADASRHVFVIEAEGKDIGFLDMVVRDGAARVGCFSTPPNAPELRRRAWDRVEATARELGATSVRVTSHETESEATAFFEGLGLDPSPASRAGWTEFRRSLV